ncbi:hypothetical protein AX14_005425 [Amanita brunnescens Koide BX004]|nr:hypothetical protein AX14_005425 [Amanita brunnescens Koide BX004]
MDALPIEDPEGLLLLEEEEDLFDMDELIDFTHDEPEDWDDHMVDVEETPSEAPIAYQNTLHLKSRLAGADVLSKVKNVINCMRNEGLNLPLFLDAIFYGDLECHNDKVVQYQRTALMVSDELPVLFERWYQPPSRSQGYHGQRPLAATKNIVNFARSIVNREIDGEIKRTAKLFMSGPELLSKEHLLSLDFHSLITECRNHAPTMKNPDMIVLSMISQCHYTRSYRRGRLAKAWAIYLKACGMSACAFDAIHSLGLTMSHKWTADALRTLSASAMEEIQELVKTRPFFLSYDNVNVPLRVFSQRLHNQSHFQNGCAGTVWLIPRDAALPPAINAALPLIDGNPETEARWRVQYIHQILLVLLNSPEFKDYPATHRKHICLSAPPPVHELPIGDNYRNVQYMMETAPIEEASYDGNDKVIAEWFHQLRLDSDAEQKLTALHRVLVCCGDQLTMDRLRGLYKFRSEDFNSFDRMDYLVLAPGWFHIVMAFALSLYKQHYGNSSSVGQLRHAFDLLHKKKMSSPATKGPFWNDLDEALRHVSEAHFRACWLELTGVNNLDELKKQSPLQLHAHAINILDRYASMAALDDLRERMPTDKRDLVQENSIMWNMNILTYLELTAAIRQGDVGRMEDILPIILFRFAGGGNFKYTAEILELFQGLRSEWPPEVWDLVRNYCWVVNREGLRNSFVAVDQAQEQNIKDIKVTYRSFGPGASWNYLQTVSPAIPTLRAVQRHFERQFGTLTRGTKHGQVSKDEDVKILTEHYQTVRLYSDHPGRVPKGEDKSITDYVTAGTDALENGDTFAKWWKARHFVRSNVQEWDSD